MIQSKWTSSCPNYDINTVKITPKLSASWSRKYMLFKYLTEQDSFIIWWNPSKNFMWLKDPILFCTQCLFNLRHSLQKSSADLLSLFIYKLTGCRSWVNKPITVKLSKIALYWHSWLRTHPDIPDVVYESVKHLCRPHFCHVQQYSGIFQGQLKIF